MTEPKYDISIGSVPRHVEEVALAQAKELGVAEVRDMLIIQRRIGEYVIAERLVAGDEYRTFSARDLLAMFNDTSAIRHKRHGSPVPDRRQLELGQCVACDEPGTKGLTCKECGEEVR